MKSNKKGTTLIELMMYTMISGIIFSLCFDFVGKFFWPMLEHNRLTSQLVCAYTVQNFFMRDVRAAPRNQENWRSIAKNELIWHAQEYDVGWSFQDKKIIRTIGEFNKDKNKWITSTKSIALQNIQDCTFNVTYSRDDHYSIIGVENRLVLCSEDKRHVLKRTIFIRNGMSL